MNNQRLSYFIDSASRYFGNKSCPFCKTENVKLIDRKYFVTRLFECTKCHLYFRHPKDKKGFNTDFYQEQYEEFGITTNIPYGTQLAIFKQNNFKNSGKDYSDKIRTMSLLKPGKIKVVDYGSSWGYVSYQFKNAGFITQSFEISSSMAKKGNELLGLDIKNNLDDLVGDNDIFFTSHVIEHLSDINHLFQVAKKLLKPDGIFVAYSPNGSKAYRKLHPEIFHSLWGLVHPNFMNSDFYSTVFNKNPYIITSCPYDKLSLFTNWDSKSHIIGDTSGEELLFICKINENCI